MNVRRQLDGSSAALKLVEPKTVASLRSIPVPTMVVDELARHLAQFGPGPDGVILSHHGGFMSDNAFNWLWRCTQRDAGVEVGSLRFHWLRHAFASSLISAGCSVKAAADAMGHGSPTVTLETYASLWPGDDDRIRSAIDAAWRIEDSLRTEDAGKRS